MLSGTVRVYIRLDFQYFSLDALNLFDNALQNLVSQNQKFYLPSKELKMLLFLGRIWPRSTKAEWLGHIFGR